MNYQPIVRDRICKEPSLLVQIVLSAPTRDKTRMFHSKRAGSWCVASRGRTNPRPCLVISTTTLGHDWMDYLSDSPRRAN